MAFLIVLTEIYSIVRTFWYTYITIDAIVLGYSPRTKVLARLNEQTSDPKLAIKLPRLAFEISSMDYDPAARVSKHKNFTKVVTGDTLQLHKLGAPAVYKVGFELNIMAQTQDEALQLLEQILPMFQPEYTVTIKDIPTLDIKTDTPILLTSVALNDDYEGDLVTRRAIVYTLGFETRIRYYRGLSKSKQILQPVKLIKNVATVTNALLVAD